jgi:C-terminal processing protease CtpA/Prc
MYTKVFALGCLIFCLTTSFIKAQDKLTISQLKADFSLFEHALQEAHPGLYRYNYKGQIDSLFLQTKNSINHEMTQQEFYQLLLPLVVQIKCGHTKFHPDSNWSTNFYYNTEKVFPLRLFFQGKKAYAIGNYEAANSIPAGSEVLEINGNSVSDIIDKMLNSFCSDGNNTTFKYIEMNHYFSAYYANLFEGPDTFSIKYRNGQDIAEIKVPSVSHEKIEQYEKHLAEMANDKPMNRINFQGNQTAVLSIPSFWEGTEKRYKQFLKNSFEAINQKKVKNLIIDLRNNEGGIDRRGSLLLSYLMNCEFNYYDRLEVTTRKKYSFAKQAHLPKFYGIYRHLISKENDSDYRWTHNKNLKVQKPQKNNFSGGVYVLINGASFSVTTEFAAITHFHKRATFIGEETGGAYYGNNSGTFVIVTLPNSKLNVGIPMVAYYTAVSGYSFNDRGVIPDYKVEPTVSNIISAQDPVLEFSLKLIENGNRQQSTEN